MWILFFQNPNLQWWLNNFCRQLYLFKIVWLTLPFLSCWKMASKLQCKTAVSPAATVCVDQIKSTVFFTGCSPRRLPRLHNLSTANKMHLWFIFYFKWLNNIECWLLKASLTLRCIDIFSFKYCLHKYTCIHNQHKIFYHNEKRS